MSTKKGKKPYVHLLRLLIVAFVLAVASISVLSSPKAHAATVTVTATATHPGKTVGAEIIVNGKVIKLTTVSAAPAATVRPNAVQNCAFVNPSETSVSASGTAATFNYSLNIQNACASVSVTRGNWQAQGSIECDGAWYTNAPSDSGGVPTIAAGKSVKLRDQNPYEAICLGVILGTIPYTYPPSEIQIVTGASGSLSNNNTWSDLQEDFFVP